MANQIILFPFGGNAKETLAVIQDINKVEKTWDVVGFVDDNMSFKGKECLGIKVLGDKKVLAKFPKAKVLAVPGSPTNYLKRQQVIESLNLPTTKFATIVHPSVTIAADAKIGTNVLIMANVVLSCQVTVGNHCVLLPNTTISHDSVVGDYSCIGSNVAVAGSVTIGKNCYIGSGSSVRDHITIGEKSLIGLGSTVVNDVKKATVMIGNPAKELRKAKA